MSISRRHFMQRSAAAALSATAWASLSRRAAAFPLGLAPGVQLWSVGDELEQDEDGTLRALAKIGFKEVELFELPKSPVAFRKNFDNLGLKIVGGHFYLDSLRRQETLDSAHVLGLHYLIVVFPTLRVWADKDISNMTVKELNPAYEKITLEDYRWNAEQLNKLGVTVKRSGLQLGYHNHAIDLKPLGNIRGLDVLIDATDPHLVVFEMDCGHVIHAGQDPIAYLKKYGSRIQLLHLKDLKAGYGVSSSIDTEEKDTNAELGLGVIDWQGVFNAAKPAGVKHYFIEHEGKMDHSHLEALQISYRYLERLT
jgi:sugar phosphate isomerase/epimerase